MCNLLQHYWNGYADTEQEVWHLQEHVSWSLFVQVVQKFELEQLSVVQEQFQLCMKWNLERAGAAGVK